MSLCSLVVISDLDCGDVSLTLGTFSFFFFFFLFEKGRLYKETQNMSNTTCNKEPPIHKCGGSEGLTRKSNLNRYFTSSSKLDL